MLVSVPIIRHCKESIKAPCEQRRKAHCSEEHRIILGGFMDLRYRQAPKKEGCYILVLNGSVAFNNYSLIQ